MRQSAIAEEDRPSALTPAPWRVAKLQVLPDFRLHVVFNDGAAGTVDMSQLVHAPDAGVFSALAEPERFAQAYVEMGAVTWPGELDLAPDAMHTEILAHGQWVPTAGSRSP